MKLLLCDKCKTIISIDKAMTTCHCGRSRAYYKSNGLDVLYAGPAILLGCDNKVLQKALLKSQKNTDAEAGTKFSMFVIPNNAKTIKKVIMLHGIPQTQYRKFKDIPYVTGKMIIQEHTEEQVENFNEWFFGQTSCVVTDPLEGEVSGIYTWDYERWLTQNMQKIQSDSDFD